MAEDAPGEKAATAGTATVLVVDDEAAIADLYATWLAERHEVRVAYGGEPALEAVDEDVDVLLLDRQMPDLSGDQVLRRVRERGVDCRAVMVTAVDPDFDIVEMPFDDYLTKPVDADGIEGAVERMLERDGYDDAVREYFALAEKKAALESEKSALELERSDRYRELVERVEAARQRADADVERTDDFEAMFRDLPDG